MIISKNVIYTNLNNTHVKADVIELNIKQKIQKYLCIEKEKKLILKSKN